MRIETNRFGTLDIEEREVIQFAAGLIGFPEEQSFVLLRPNAQSPIGWLQSTATPWLALPVVSADALARPYPDDTVIAAIASFGVRIERGCAVMVVVHAAPPPGIATVNLVAPIIVNVETRQGAQILVDGSSFSTQERFILRPRPVAAASENASTKATPIAPIPPAPQEEISLAAAEAR